MAVMGHNVIEGRTSLFTVFRKAAETLRHYNLDNMESLRRLLRLGPLPPGKWTYGCIFFFHFEFNYCKDKNVKR